MGKGRSEVITALDVGTTKVCCFIARQDDAGDLAVIGIGHQLADGMHCGTVIDAEAVEASIRAAVDGAERMAGTTISKVVVNVSGGAPQSRTLGVDMAISGHEVGAADLRAAMAEGRRICNGSASDVIHALPVGYTIDGIRGIRDPQAMVGDRLGIDLHVVTARPGPVRNLEACLARGHLGIEDLVVSPYAAALSSLIEDEKRLGVTVIDMGGGTTSVAVFVDGTLAFCAVLPIGGQHVTNDIARGLLTAIGSAERLKTLYGSAIASPSDDRDMIDVPQIGEDEVGVSNLMPRSALVRIIRPRIEETLEMVRDCLAEYGMNRMAGRHVVLTGGACQLSRVPELAARMLDKQVRLGRPINVAGLAEATAGPAFAVCAGLLVYAARRPEIEARRHFHLPQPVHGGMLARLGQWLKENF